MITTTAEKFDIACIGFKRMGNTSKRMYYYKLNRNSKEYLLVNAGMIRLLHMQWTEKNEFVNSDLWDDFARPFPIIEDQIGDAVKNCVQKHKELQEDEEKTHFIQHMAQLMKKGDTVKFKKDQDHRYYGIGTIESVRKLSTGSVYISVKHTNSNKSETSGPASKYELAVEEVKPEREKGVLIGNEVNSLMHIINDNAPFLDEHKFFTLTKEMIEAEEEDFLELAGYQAKYTYEGDHRNDSQMVDYTFTLKSPAGKITTIETEMCLMVGWNFGYSNKLTIA